LAVTENLVLGMLAILVGAGTLVVRFVLPPPKIQRNDPYVGIVRQGWFAPLVLGFLPLVAGLAFLGAWVNAAG
jgi:hypothetical protein